MLDSQINTARPARRTAFISRELSRYSIDIVALAETRLPDEGNITEDNFFWKGHPTHERTIHGVGFAIRNSLADQIEEALAGISPRLMRMRVPLTNHLYATIFSCEEDKDSFYVCLDAELQRVSSSDKIIIFGDFNVRVGSSYLAWEDVIGHHGLGKDNSNRHRLLSLCARHHLVITNTIFAIKDIYKGTWQHPRSKLWHTLDNVAVRQLDRNNVNVTRPMRGAECWTDHRLVRSKMSLRIRPPVKRRAPNRKTQLPVTEYLGSTTGPLAEISRTLANREPQEVYANRVEEIWSTFARGVTEAAGEVLGYTKHKNQHWFDDNNAEIHRLLEERNRVYGNFLRNPSSIHPKRTWQEKSAEAQRSLRVMVNAWWLDISAELRRHADAGD